MRTRVALTLAALTVAVAAPTVDAVTKSVRLESKTSAPATITIHAGDGIRFGGSPATTTSAGSAGRRSRR